MCRDCKSHRQAPQSWTQKSTTLLTLHRSHTVWEWNHPGLRLPLRVAVRHPDPLMMTTNTGFTTFISEGRSATLQARSSICNRILLFSPKQHLLCLDSRTGTSPGQAETTASHFLEAEVAGSCSSSCLWATDPKLALRRRGPLENPLLGRAGGSCPKSTHSAWEGGRPASLAGVQNLHLCISTALLPRERGASHPSPPWAAVCQQVPSGHCKLLNAYLAKDFQRSPEIYQFNSKRP